jgi:hypothetical protein
MAEHVHHRGWARALVVLAGISAFLAIFAIWVNRQVLNTDNFAETSSKMLDNDVIRAQVSDYLVDQLYQNVDVAAEIGAALPDRLQPLAAPAAGAFRDFAERTVNEALQRPRAQQAWENANRAAHQLLLKTLDGGGPNVATNDGVVTLDLKNVLTEMEQRVGIGGRIADKLPPDAAQITVLESDQLDTAQSMFKLLRHLPVILLGLSLALFGIALAIAPGWRRKAVRAYGIGFLVAGALALAAVAILGDLVVGSLAKTEAIQPAIDNTWVLSTSLLTEVADAAIFYGIVLLLGALLAGPTSTAVAIRRTLAPYLREPALAYGGIAVVLGVVVLWWEPTPAMHNPWTAALFTLLCLAGFEALRRKTALEFPEADDPRAAASRAKDRIVHVAKSTTTRPGSPEPVAVAVTSQSARLGDLERLSVLHDAGGIDDKEFVAEKARILNGG